jgi:hypothetical protein
MIYPSGAVETSRLSWPVVLVVPARPLFLRTEIGAVAKTHLGSELSVALRLQGLDQCVQREILREVRVGRDPARFVSEDSPILFLDSFQLDRTAESPLSIVKAGEPMLVEAKL